MTEVTPPAATAYPFETIRAHFPALQSGIAFFDGPGGTQVPDVVGDAVRDTLVAPISNRGRTTESERYADATVGAARRAMADLLAADPRGVVFAPQHDPADLRLLPDPGHDLAAWRRGRGQSARPRRQRRSVGAGRRGCGRHHRLVRLRS